MEACLAVEREVDKVLSKFGSINDHADRVLGELLMYIEGLKTELQNGMSQIRSKTKDIILDVIKTFSTTRSQA